MNKRPPTPAELENVAHWLATGCNVGGAVLELRLLAARARETADGDVLVCNGHTAVHRTAWRLTASSPLTLEELDSVAVLIRRGRMKAAAEIEAATAKPARDPARWPWPWTRSP
jgi:hypothetical protein